MINLMITLYAVMFVGSDDSKKTYDTIIQENKQSVIVFHHESCGNSAAAKNYLSKNQYNTRTFIIEAQDPKDPFPYNACQFMQCGVPNIMYHRSNNIEDITIGFGKDDIHTKIRMQEFYRRNEQNIYPPESLTQEMIDHEIGFYYDSADDFRLWFGNGALVGGSFKNRRLKEAIFSNSDLRATSFEDTIIEGAVFTRANLKGASFKGAKLSNILWGACICPDGTKSSAHGYTCEGHLKPFKYKTLPKTTLKPLPYQRPVPLTDELKDIGKDFEQRLDAANAKVSQQP